MPRTTPKVLPASPAPRSAPERLRSRPQAARRAPGGEPGEPINLFLRRYKDLGTELLAAGLLEAALSAFQEVVKAAPDEPAHRQKVAEILQRLGRTREAIAEYETAAEAWARTGWLLRAIALCKVILQLDARHTRTQVLLANLHARHRQSRGSALDKAPGPSAPVGRAAAPALQQAPAGAPPVEPRAPVPLFSALGREVFLAVLGGVERCVFEPGEEIVQEGAPGGSMFIIVEGEVSVVRQAEAGQRVTVAKLGEGELFGEMALLCEGPRLASVVALTRTVLLEFSRERMEHLATRYPQLAEVVERLHRERLLANVLRCNPLFAAWPQALRQAVAEAFTPVVVKEGEELLSRGQPTHALYLLLRGRCTVFHAHVDGQETPYPDLGEGDVFGEVSLLRSKLATASVRATTPCVLLKLERVVLDQLLLRQPELAQALRRLGSERLLRTNRLLSGRPLHLGDARV